MYYLDSQMKGDRDPTGYPKKYYYGLLDFPSRPVAWTRMKLLPRGEQRTGHLTHDEDSVISISVHVIFTDKKVSNSSGYWRRTSSVTTHL